MKKGICIIIFFLSLLATDTFSCTIIMVRGNGVAIAGSNEDFFSPLTLMWYIPASEKYYARVCFGFNMIMNSTQGGMNEHGLFVDGNSLGNQGWKPDKNKKSIIGSILDQLLATCRSVEEVKDFFRDHNCPALDVARIPVMDKSGASMIVEWYNGEVVFLETEKDYQISTNFVGSKYVGQEKPCRRYNTADKLLSQQSSFSVNTVQKALDETHVEGPGSITLYSFICNLKSGDIYVYNFHDFSNLRKFNFSEEIKKGQHFQYMAEVFTERSPAYNKFIQDGPLELVNMGLRTSRFQATIFYQVLKANYPRVFEREIGPELLSELASGLLTEGRVEDAIFFLERNASDFTGIPSVHYELAQIYHKTDNREKAIKEYKLTLELDPEHEGARKALDMIMSHGTARRSPQGESGSLCSSTRLPGTYLSHSATCSGLSPGRSSLFFFL
ncbi:MAG TPA: tetratricopeptide repeat protein [Bacteroidetes bacterium]|nr:tetratricopeptide repeat protein [Bacteroidota bacterium]